MEKFHSEKTQSGNVIFDDDNKYFYLYVLACTAIRIGHSIGLISCYDGYSQNSRGVFQSSE